MEKWSVEKYCDRLQAMKCEAHDKLWLYIEVNAKKGCRWFIMERNV